MEEERKEEEEAKEDGLGNVQYPMQYRWGPPLGQIQGPENEWWQPQGQDPYCTSPICVVRHASSQEGAWAA